MFKKVINIVLIIAFGLSLALFGTLKLTRDLFNTSTSDVKRSEEASSGNEGVGATYNIKGEDKLVSYAEIQNIDSVNIKIAHKYLDADLKKQGIPTDALEYVLAEDDYKGMYYDYRKDAIGYLKDENDKPVLDIDRILGMVDRGLKKYNSEKGTNLPVDKIKEETKKVADGIDTKIVKLKENKVLTKTLKVVTNKPLYIGMLALLIICAILLMFINKITDGIKKIGYGFIVGGIFSIIISLLINVSIFNKLKELVSTMVKYMSGKALANGIIYLIVGVVLIVIALLIHNDNKKKKTIIEEIEPVLEEEKEEISKKEKSVKKNSKKKSK